MVSMHSDVSKCHEGLYPSPNGFVLSTPAVTLLQTYDFVELWAGQGMTTQLMRGSGRNVAALDIDYFKPDDEHPTRTNHYDILTPAGFAYRCSKQVCLCIWIIFLLVPHIY